MKRILSILLCVILITSLLPLNVLAEGPDEVSEEPVSDEVSTPAPEEPQTPATEEPAEDKAPPAAEEPADHQETPAAEETSDTKEVPAAGETNDDEAGEKDDTADTADTDGDDDDADTDASENDDTDTDGADASENDADADDADDVNDKDDADDEEKDDDEEEEEEEEVEDEPEAEQLETQTVTAELSDTTLSLTGEMPVNARADMDRGEGGEKLDVLLDVTISILREATEEETEPTAFEPAGTLTLILSDPAIRQAREQGMDILAARLTETGVELMKLLESETDSVKFETTHCGEYVVAAREIETIESWETDGLTLELTGYGFTAQAAEPELEEGLTLLRAYELTAESEFRLLRLSLTSEMELGEKESVDVYTLSSSKLGSPVSSLPATLNGSFAVVLDSGMRRQTLEDGLVSLEGLLPKDAEMTSQDVLDNYSDFTAVDPESEEAPVTSVAAFDITIRNDGEIYEPDDGVDVTIDISSSVNDAMLETLRLWHVLDDGTVEEVTEFTVEDGQLCFEAASFSDYVLTTVTIAATINAGDGSTYEVTVTYPVDAGIPDGVHLEVEEVVSGEIFDEYAEKTAEQLGSAEGLRLFDISIADDTGRTYEPRSGVRVEVALKLLEDSSAGVTTDKLRQIVHFGEEETEVLTPGIEMAGDGFVYTFTTNGFSYVAATNATNPDQYVCRIKDSNGVIQGYADAIQDAYNNVPDGGSIEMLDDVVLTAQVEINLNVHFTLTTAEGEDFRGTNTDSRAVISRDSSFTTNKSSLFRLTNGEMTLKNIIIDGNNVSVKTNGALFQLQGANASTIPTLNLDSGALLRNGIADGSGGENAYGNASCGRGGAIMCYENSSLNMKAGSEITNCEAHRNNYYAGGAICLGGNYGKSENVHFLMSGGTISNCRAPAEGTGNHGGAGGAIAIDHEEGEGSQKGFIKITGGLITGCSAYKCGSAIEIHGALVMTGGTITENVTTGMNRDGYAGAVNFYANDRYIYLSGSPVIENNINTASGERAANLDISNHYNEHARTDGCIVVEGNLDPNAHIGVTPFKSTDNDQTGEDKVFGVYTTSVDNNFDIFTNDLDDTYSLVGAPDGNGHLIWARGFKVKVFMYVGDENTPYATIKDTAIEIPGSSGRYYMVFDDFAAGTASKQATIDDVAAAYCANENNRYRSAGGSYQALIDELDAEGNPVLHLAYGFMQYSASSYVDSDPTTTVHASRTIERPNTCRQKVVYSYSYDTENESDKAFTFGSTLYLYYYIEPVCKVTDGSGNLLYLADGRPAVFKKLETAFTYIGTANALKTSASGDGDYNTSQNATQIQMLVKTYEQTGQALVPLAKKVTMTTATESAADGFPYRGTSETAATIKRAYNGESLIVYDASSSSNGNRSTLILGNITLDGNGNNFTASGNGGLIQVPNNKYLTVGTGASLINSKGAKGSIYLAQGSYMYVSGSPNISGSTYENGPCDVYIDDSRASNINITELHLAGNLMTDIGVYALTNHMESAQQFAVRDNSSYTGEAHFINQRVLGLAGEMKDTTNIRWTKTNVQLTVTNAVAGPMGDPAQDFNYTLSGGPANKQYAYQKYSGTTLTSSGTLTADASGSVTFTLRHNEKMVLIVPMHTELTLSEAQVSLYTTDITKSNETNNSVAINSPAVTFNLGNDLTLNFTNTFPEITPTGVDRNTDPFLAMLAIGATIALTPKVLKKRRKDSDEGGAED